MLYVTTTNRSRIYLKKIVAEESKILETSLTFATMIWRRSLLIRGMRKYTWRESHSLKASNTYCRELVRSYDYENYLVGLLIPRKARDAFFAIRAFNVEIASIKDNTPRNSFQASRLRFQYWKDTLDQIYTSGINPSNNQPVAHSLEYYVHQHDFRRRWFERSLEARYVEFWVNLYFSGLN